MAGFRSKVFTFLAVLSLLAGHLAAQDAPLELTDPKDLGDQALNAQVIDLIGENEFLKARPYLQEMKKRMEEQENEENMEAIVFFLASAHLEEYQNNQDNKEALKAAIKGFEEYVEKYPNGPRKTIALLNLGDAYSDLKEYGNAISTYTKIYNDPRTSGSVRNDIRRVIAKTYLKTDKPEAGMAYYQEAYEQAILDEEAKAEAATWLLQAYLSKGDIDAILPYFNDLTGRKAALFNPKFNVTLIKAGDQLFESGNYDFAILFYAIVKKKDDIVAFYEQAVEQLKLALSYKSKGSEEAISIEKRLREAEANLKAVKSIRDYDADVRWRTARVLLESQRTWEALWSFYNLMLDYPEHEQAEEFLFLAFSQASKVKDNFMVVKLAKDYLSRREYNKYRGQVTLDLATYYRDVGEEQKFYELTTSYLDEGPDQDKAASQIANQLGIYLINKELYAELYDRMDRYSKSNRSLGETTEAAKYWSSLGLVIAADYNRALESFNQFIDEYGESSIFSEDAYYRRAICIYGAQNADAAYKEFANFVERYPSSSRRGEAELYLGDIMREKGNLDAALGHYRKVEEFTNNQTFITKATFATSEVLEMKDKDKEAAQTLETYIERYGQAAELGEAYLRLGRFEERQGNVAERFRYNFLGLQATANDPRRYAADQILLEYVKDYPIYVANYESAINLIEGMIDDPAYRESIMRDRAAQYKYFQTEEGKKVDPKLTQKIVRDRAFRKNMQDRPQEILSQLRSDYKARLDQLDPYKPELIFSKLVAEANAPKTVLELRLAMARDRLNDGEMLFPFTDDQVKNASPAVMLWRAEKLRTINPAQANELLEVSLRKHPYAPNRYDTMLTKAQIAKEKALGNPSEQNWKNALAQYEQLIERFGMRAEDGVPFIAKGEILIKLGREDEALSVLSDILRNPEWRGEPQAKAHLFLGIAYYNMQSYAQAHGFFERLMLGFGGFREQVALAYYWDLKTLEAMNESESVSQLLSEVRTRDDLKDTKGYRLIEENYAL
jgi:TolA-binding protein